MRTTTILKYGFIAYGMVMVSGIVTVFIPDDMMVFIGEQFDLPAFEVTPVFEYMARGLSLVSFLFGLLMFYFAFHPLEQAELIICVGWVSFALVPIIFFIHVVSQTPLLWAVGDIAGLLILWILCMQARKLCELS